MTVDEASELLVRETWENDGAFTLLRLGQDPGPQRTLALRAAVRTLGRHFKDGESLPYTVAAAAGMIVYFTDEAKSNFVGVTGLRPELLGRELFDLRHQAFELLLGPFSDSWSIRRADLGES